MSSAGWKELPLGDVADIRVSNVDKRSVSGEIPVRLCNYLDVYQQPYLDEHRPYMAATATAAEVERFSVRAGDVLITKDSETPDDIAIPAVIDRPLPDLVCGYHLAILRPSPRVDPTWLAKQLAGNTAKRYFGCVATGSTRYGLSNVAIARCPLGLPPIKEQVLAAGVLRTVDEAIRKTEQFVAKLKRVKHGLLRDLLTRGIDENGEIRDPARHPEDFKDSPLGKLPGRWKVSELGQFLDHIIDYRGRTPKKLGMEWGGNIPALSAMNVKMGGIDLTRETYYGSDALYSKWMTNGDCRVGDVLMTMEAPLGNVAQVPDERRYILSQRVLLMRFDSEKLLNDFAAIQFRDVRFQHHLVRWSTGTTATGIQRAQLVHVPIVLPSPQEQMMIIRAVQACEARLAHEELGAAKLRLLKDGLMGDLLTGSVRVTNLLNEAAA